ncbi:ANTAR domain-containing protein [Streptomyces sp. CRN 30]|uniref:ANTAR domain-containing response regulator n=1 Tax=Streptomyces sp. CRN 30 TaxID=3075613 RepID=UPI002A82154D|nr:ANTAR domain-containing protein [Streptomyces sp. CRN 30]
MTPEQRLANAFVALAGGTEAGPLDVPRTLSVLAHRAPVLLGVRAATVVFAPEGREPALVAGSDPQVSRLEQDAAEWREGPGHDCRQAGDRPPAQESLDSLIVRQRWPHYSPRALRLGYTHVMALPLRSRPAANGALVLLSRAPRSVSPGAVTLGTSLADFTALMLERAREADRSRTLTAQLEQALSGRVIIEQAKGVLVTLRNLSPEDAFDILRKYARSRQRPVRDVAREVVEGRADPELTGGGPF